MSISKILFVIYSYAFVLLSTNASGQSAQAYIEQRIDSLITKGVDTFVWFHIHGRMNILGETDTSFIYDKSYLAWRKLDKVKILVYTYSYNINSKSSLESSSAFEVEDSLNIFPYLDSNFKSITTTKLLPAVLRTVKNSEILIEDYGRNGGSHPGYIQISIYTPLGTFRNGFTPSDLHDGIILNADGSYREKWESLHYRSNSIHPLYIFTDRLSSQIAIFDEYARFKRPRTTWVLRKLGLTNKLLLQ